MTSTSLSLLDRIRSNDPAAWDRLVALYGPLVLRWGRRAGLTEEDAADVFQEVFQATARKVGAFRRDRQGDTFRGWLYTITRNKVLDHLRRTKREPRGVGGTGIQMRMAQVPAPAAPDSSAAADPHGERLLLQRALARIRGDFKESTWRAFHRTVIDGVAPKDAAIELAMTAGAVRVAKSRVLQRLRAELGDV